MIKKFFIFIIKIYKKTISPFLEHHGIHCKYYPTCSEYTIQAIEKYGAIKGSIIGLIRIIKCNPLSKGGYDPLK